MALRLFLDIAHGKRLWWQLIWYFIYSTRSPFTIFPIKYFFVLLWFVLFWFCHVFTHASQRTLIGTRIYVYLTSANCNLENHWHNRPVHCNGSCATDDNVWPTRSAWYPIWNKIQRDKSPDACNDSCFMYRDHFIKIKRSWNRVRPSYSYNGYITNTT